VIHALDLYGPSDREHWFRLYKHAIPPFFVGESAKLATA
jgi:hypothetical protein